ncbi:uncharacterized protein LOC127880716 [Dreissena polymorpha]|uniref:C-type lectin domain-containing protein n=1 Tax=Dreissena polymorpha TaxID=45954 RepID=A0A9D4GJP0_DREPO|nr:uncharacterized protein LOC127880716 [Dreissena polymorpha]KAH3816701.1 hypothetical protein DPMN_118222 [Dreissena polymorpha]
MKILSLVLLIYLFIWNAALQEINSTSATWFDATDYCMKNNKSLIKFKWDETVTPQFKRDHAIVFRKTNMWVGNYIHFRYINGTDVKEQIDPPTDKCISAKLSTVADGLNYTFVLVPRSCTDKLPSVCGSSHCLTRVEQTSTDWFKAAEICSLWSSGFVMQPLATKGAFASGTFNFVSNANITNGTYYWTNLVRDIHHPDYDFYLPHADLHLGCGYVDKLESIIQYGDCCQEMAIYCDNNTVSNTLNPDKSFHLNNSANSCDIGGEKDVLYNDNTFTNDINVANFETCVIPYTPSISDASSAVYIGVSVGGVIGMFSFVVAAIIIHKRRNSTKVDAKKLKRQFNGPEHSFGNGDHPTTSGCVNNANINLQMNVAHPGSPREFENDKDGIAYASFNEYQPAWESPEDFFSNEAYKPVVYGTSSRAVHETSSTFEDSGYYPIHGQMATSKLTLDNTLTDDSRSKSDDETDKSYEYMEVKKSLASGNVLEKSEAFVDQNKSHDVELFTVQNFTYTSI